jgi:hypothetical protein
MSSNLNCQSDFLRPLTRIGNDNEFVPLISFQESNDTFRDLLRRPERCPRERGEERFVSDFRVGARLETWRQIMWKVKIEKLISTKAST